MSRRTAEVLVAGTALVLVWGTLARAVYLDEERRFVLRGRFYTQLDMRTQHNGVQTPTPHAPGQLVSHRTFFNPEFEADLTDFVPNLGWLSPDRLSFRMALWGFYDGLYEYMSGQYDRARRDLTPRGASQAVFFKGRSLTEMLEGRAGKVVMSQVYSYQRDPVIDELPFRLNELYINYEKGPLWLRIGRQAISWGESDTIALLDANNPFDVTRGLPGIFEDVDEARIPLWTVRGTLDLIRNWGPLSSLFAEAYWVPGPIDTTVGETPVPEVSPFSPTSSAGADNPLLPPGSSVLTFDHLPSRTIDQSRWGARLEGVLFRNYTVSTWVYRTFANPSPRAIVPSPEDRICQGVTGLCQVQEVVHPLTWVVGAAATFWSEPLYGVIRSEVEYFIDEASFIPSENLPIGKEGRVPKADYLRWELGYDANFFIRWINPANSFILVSALVGEWNTDGGGFRMPLAKPGRDIAQCIAADILPGGSRAACINRPTIDSLFVQTALQSDFMHGRLTPRFVGVFNFRGSFGFPLEVNYRFTDSFLLNVKYVLLAGDAVLGTGLFRDRDQLMVRFTYQLN